MKTQLIFLRRLLIAAVLAGVAGGAIAQGVKLPPVDEGSGDPGWLLFKARLLEALEKRDRKFVLGIVDSRIRNMSSKSGIEEFRKLWEPQSAGSPLWVELPKLLFLGGAFVKRGNAGNEFCAPYVHYRWPVNAAGDASGAIIAKESLMKTKPSAATDTLQTLSYDLVKVLDWEVADDDSASPQKWVRIRTGAGEGYVPEEQVRSPLEYRACFVRSGASWRMTGLEAGE